MLCQELFQSGRIAKPTNEYNFIDLDLLAMGGHYLVLHQVRYAVERWYEDAEHIIAW
jgi:hypothetical protein